MLLVCLPCGCATGADGAPPALGEESGDGGRPMLSRPSDGGDSDSSATDDAQQLAGDPCTMGDTEQCDCADASVQMTRRCVASPESPLGGFFSECSCAPSHGPDAMTPMRCRDGEKNGTETDTDCGGAECDRCGIDDQCVDGTDCESDAECSDDGRCSPKPAGGDGDGDVTFSNYDHGAYAFDREVAFDCAGTTTFDSTGTGTFTTSAACSDSADERFEVSCGVAQLQMGGPSVCILRASSFTLAAGHTLVLTGDKPVILAIDGDATIAGTIDASAHGVTPGAGGNYAGCGASAGMNGQSDTDIDDGAGGGAGGGFAAAGGKGGAGDRDGPNDEAMGAPASAAASDLTLVPLRGGCKGGDGSDGWNGGSSARGGAGGGAVQVSVRGTLTISGAITAGGGGGEGAQDDEDSGGGGGSGGAILLEYGALDLTGQLRAHGGGGGGGAGTGGSDPGTAGSDGSASAAMGGNGGDAGGASDGGRGGQGGSATDMDASGSGGGSGGDGEDEGVSGGGGGGGGGSAGAIVMREHDA